MLSIDKQLWYIDFVALHSIFDFLLVLAAHEHVSLLKLDQQGFQDLFDGGTLGVGVADDTHACCVDHHFAGIFFFVVLERNCKEKKFFIWGSLFVQLF
jgi:hypothetical protein